MGAEVHLHSMQEFSCLVVLVPKRLREASEVMLATCKGISWKHTGCHVSITWSLSKGHHCTAQARQVVCTKVPMLRHIITGCNPL